MTLIKPRVGALKPHKSLRSGPKVASDRAPGNVLETIQVANSKISLTKNLRGKNARNKLSRNKSLFAGQLPPDLEVLYPVQTYTPHGRGIKEFVLVDPRQRRYSRNPRGAKSPYALLVPPELAERTLKTSLGTLVSFSRIDPQADAQAPALLTGNPVSSPTSASTSSRASTRTSTRTLGEVLATLPFSGMDIQPLDAGALPDTGLPIAHLPK